VPPPAYIDDGGNMQSGGDVCGVVLSVILSAILWVINLISAQRLKL